MEGMTIVGKLRFKKNPDGLIGEGSYGHVFAGYYENIQEVAIKRLQKLSFIKCIGDSPLQEVQVMLKACSHPNILRYVWSEMNEDYVFIATELCAGTLHDWIEGTYKGPKIEIDEREMLRQVTKGLAYLHFKKIIHRDMKPNNILIFAPEDSGGLIEPQMKIADFGLSKMLRSDQIDLSTKNRTDPGGAKGWIAPELFDSDLRYDCKVDIFPLGCIFGYTLSKGKHHSFGDDPDKRSVRIKEKLEPEFLTLDDLKGNYSNDFTLKLVQSMIAMDPNERPTAQMILENSFFHYSNPRDHGKNESMKKQELMSSSSARLRSFSNWPEGLAQRPAQLAEAGFYYLNIGDQVRCFCCQGGLTNWKPKDDPWFEHAFWYPSCNYLISKKGEYFVTKAK